MSDLLLKGMVNAELAARRSKDALVDRWNQSRESGDIVQTIIIIAIFVLIVVVVGKLLYDAIVQQGNSVSKCIKGGSKAACDDFKVG